MDKVISDFNNTVKEIECYFLFLKNMLGNQTEITVKNALSIETHKIDEQLQKILKANTFVLLYNLVESSFKSTILKLNDDINNERTTYKNGIPEIRKIWLRYEEKYFTKNNQQDKLTYVYDMVNNLAKQELKVPKKLEDIDLTGNLDAKRIKEYAQLYGIKSNIFDGTCEQLFMVKNRRNSLAHGNSSFSECGRDYDYQQLETIKEAVINYMRNVLEEFQQHLNRKYYKTA